MGWPLGVVLSFLIASKRERDRQTDRQTCRPLRLGMKWGPVCEHICHIQVFIELKGL